MLDHRKILSTTQDLFIGFERVVFRLQDIYLQLVTYLLLGLHFLLVTILLSLLCAGLLWRVITLPTMVLKVVKVRLEIPIMGHCEDPVSFIRSNLCADWHHLPLLELVTDLSCRDFAVWAVAVPEFEGVGRMKKGSIVSHLFAFFGLVLRCNSHTWS